jgi:predicted permease
VGLGLIYALMALAAATGWFALTPRLAQLMLIASSTPTAVNCMLLCLEFDNHPEFAARAVFTSTMASPITVTLVIFVAQSGWLPGF